MTPLPPGQHGKYCAACDHAVVDVTSMPVAEGRRFLNELTTAVHQDSAQRTCLRAHATPSGQLVPGRRKLLTHALATMLACTMAGCVGDGPELGNSQKPEPQQQTQPVPVPGMVAPQPANVIRGKCAAPVPSPNRTGTIAKPSSATSATDVAH